MNTQRILVVDDEPNVAANLLSQIKSIRDTQFVVTHPRDLTENDLKDTAVMVVDHFLEDWHEVESLLPAYSPLDGFALAAVLRSHTRSSYPGPAISILTGKLKELAGPLPEHSAEHLLAWQHDVEWVFSKSSRSNPERLVEMADAVSALRQAWTEPFEIDNLASD